MSAQFSGFRVEVISPQLGTIIGTITSVSATKIDLLNASVNDQSQIKHYSIENRFITRVRILSTGKERLEAKPSVRDQRREFLRNIPNTQNAYVCLESPPLIIKTPGCPRETCCGSPPSKKDLGCLRVTDKAAKNSRRNRSNGKHTRSKSTSERIPSSDISGCESDPTFKNGRNEQIPIHSNISGHRSKFNIRHRRKTNDVGWSSLCVEDFQDEDFDFEGNLARFDKQAFYNMVDAHQAKSLKEIKDKELLAPVDFSLFEGPDGVGPPLLDSSSLRKDESSTKNAKVLATSDKLSVKQSINRRANEKSCNRNKSRYAVSDVEPSSSTIRPSDNSNVIHFIKELGANSNSSGLPVSSSYSCTNTSDTTKSPLVHLTSNHKSSNDKNSDSVLRSLTAQLSTLMTSRSMSLSQGLTEQLNPQHTMTQQKNACNLAQLRVSHLPETSVPPTDRAMVSLMSRDPIGDKWLSPSGHRVPRLSAAQRRCLLQYLTLGRIEAPLSSTSIAVAHGFGWSRLVETAARALIDNIWSGLHCADAQGLPTCNGQRFSYRHPPPRIIILPNGPHLGGAISICLARLLAIRGACVLLLTPSVFIPSRSADLANDIAGNGLSPADSEIAALYRGELALARSFAPRPCHFGLCDEEDEDEEEQEHSIDKLNEEIPYNPDGSLSRDQEAFQALAQSHRHLELTRVGRMWMGRIPGLQIISNPTNITCLPSDMLVDMVLIGHNDEDIQSQQCASRSHSDTRLHTWLQHHSAIRLVVHLSPPLPHSSTSIGSEESPVWLGANSTSSERIYELGLPIHSPPVFPSKLDASTEATEMMQFYLVDVGITRPMLQYVIGQADKNLFPPNCLFDTGSVIRLRPPTSTPRPTG